MGRISDIQQIRILQSILNPLVKKTVIPEYTVSRLTQVDRLSVLLGRVMLAVKPEMVGSVFCKKYDFLASASNPEYFRINRRFPSHPFVGVVRLHRSGRPGRHGDPHNTRT
jgi:hypothetical protein